MAAHQGVGSLYRTLCAAADYDRPRDLTKERLVILERLGYIHRKKRVELNRNHGLLARKRAPPPRRDTLRESREWRDQRRRVALAMEMGKTVEKIARLQKRGESVPTQIWTELDRVSRAPHHQPPGPPPGPGAYLPLATTNAAPAITMAPQLDRARGFASVALLDNPGPGVFYNPRRDLNHDAPAFSFGRAPRRAQSKNSSSSL
ncbi:hypothetical protein CTAYLR_001745 [Chrysophaeum taylorii]|uniref:Uncharacterized protein n=1 Tax=Chrysophaeum taylorii TaxID=2483200 RepID=A0AAD7XL83_9STRA|nr:hypothetical protein CTAYLR_001745 [Chrysophaeum taylorii]